MPNLVSIGKALASLSKLNKLEIGDTPALPGQPSSAVIPGIGPTQIGGNSDLQRIASEYARARGINQPANNSYAQIDPEFAEYVARQYGDMADNANDPRVKASYDALIEQTNEQYEALLSNGYKPRFMGAEDPYSNSPYMALNDLHQNKELTVFKTEPGGYGSDAEFDAQNNPMLGKSDFMIDGQPALYNDLFRFVHDAMGHGPKGAGFRAMGEENAFREHSAIFTPDALPALAAETRGQNSWMNYGPHGDTNRTASLENSTFADQKAGIMNNLATYGRTPLSEGRGNGTIDQNGNSILRNSLDGALSPDGSTVNAVHHSKHRLENLDPEKYGTGLSGRTRTERNLAYEDNWINRSFAGLETKVDPYRIENGIGGRTRNIVQLPIGQIYDLFNDPDGLGLLPAVKAARNNNERYATLTKAVRDAGYSAHYQPGPTGKTLQIYDKLDVKRTKPLFSHPVATLFGGSLAAAGLLQSEDADAGPLVAGGRRLIDSRFSSAVGGGNERKGVLDSVETMQAGIDPRAMDKGSQHNLYDFEGSPYILTQSDRSAAGGVLNSIHGKEIDPVDLPGGRDFMFDPSSNGQVWASDPNVVKSLHNRASALKKEFGQDPLILPYTMAPTGIDFSTMPLDTMINYARQGMSKKNIKNLDKQIEAIIPDWGGVMSADSNAIFRYVKGPSRKKVADLIDKSFRDVNGGLSISEARAATTDASQYMEVEGSLKNIGRIDTSSDPIADSGHSTYIGGLPGEGVGTLAQPVNARSLMEQNGRVLANDMSDIRALSMNHGLSQGVIDEKLLKSVYGAADPRLLAAVAGGAAGVMATGETEASPMSKFGQLRDARKQLFDTAPMSREVAEVFANEKSRNLIRDESELRKTKTRKWRRENPPSPELVEASKRGMPGIGKLTLNDQRNFGGPLNAVTDLVSAGAVSTVKEIAGFAAGALMPEWGKKVQEADPWFKMGDQAQGIYDKGANWMGENIAPTIGRGINAMLDYQAPMSPSQTSLREDLSYAGDQYGKTPGWLQEHIGPRAVNAAMLGASVWPGKKAISAVDVPVNSMAPVIEQ